MQNNKSYDIYIVGVGGQGVLTIGELISEAAVQAGIPVNFFPTKGMSQRGGLVKAQLRLGAENVGPSMPEQSADLVVAMELSEALKALPYLGNNTEYLLYSNVWLPTAAMLGKAEYPSKEAVCSAITGAGAKLYELSPQALPVYEGKPVRDNLFVLGAILGSTALKDYISAAAVAQMIAEKWPKAKQANLAAFNGGLSYGML